MISDRCRGVSARLWPICLPAFRACANPFMVRSRIIARSNSANAPGVCVINCPAGVAVLTASVSDRNPASAAAIAFNVNKRSLSERGS